MQLGRLDKQTLANKRPKVPPCSGPESTASTGSGTSEAEEWQVGVLVVSHGTCHLVLNCILWYLMVGLVSYLVYLLST